MVGDLGRVAVPKQLVGQVAPGQKVILGFRSADAHLVPEGESLPSGGLAIRAEVLNCEPNFARHYQLVNVQAADLIFGVQTPLDMPINTGWRVHVIIADETAYLFDEESGMRILSPEESSQEEAPTEDLPLA